MHPGKNINFTKLSEMVDGKEKSMSALSNAFEIISSDKYKVHQRIIKREFCNNIIFRF
jgi:hypothetical protein